MLFGHVANRSSALLLLSYSSAFTPIGSACRTLFDHPVDIAIIFVESNHIFHLLRFLFGKFSCLAWVSQSRLNSYPHSGPVDDWGDFAL